MAAASPHARGTGAWGVSEGTGRDGMGSSEGIGIGKVVSIESYYLSNRAFIHHYKSTG
jgi:hypothetical protein